MNNFDLSRFDGKDIVFVGAGKGRAMDGVEQFLNQHSKITSFTGVDKQDNDEPLGFLRDYDPAKTIFIKNEGIPGYELPVPYITQLQIFFDLVTQTGSTTVGITGTKGKSTTTALTAHILKAAGKKVVLAGNIGISPLAALNNATAETIFVLELSSYQLSDLSVSPHISACINLYNDHTDWHGSIEEYWDAKHNIMRFAGSDDIFIYNPDFPELQNWAVSATCQTRPIDPEEHYDFGTAKLYGDHNRLNILVAREIARALGVSDDITHHSVLSFQPLEHRMEYVASKMGRTYINDAIGMTPESTLASLKAVIEKYGLVGCLMLGGKDRNYDFGKLTEEIIARRIPCLVLFPDTQEKFKVLLQNNDYEPEIFETEDMAKAVDFASKMAPEGSVVLLSTAAPSYSVWKDFEDKGTQFKSAVNRL